tara:strand:+ start:1618 stop:1842 length:225 start_codon:yes stop_codon:yes gene_type:complete
MIEIDKNLQMVILLFLGILFLLYRTKPNQLYDGQGNLKQFGTGVGKTITPLWLVSLVAGLLIYVYITVKNDDYV